MKPYLSVCMIVRDEEKVLRRCLDSLPRDVDELVIVDTGSTDATKAIAAEYTDKVYSFAWTGSFSDARNYAQSRASGEWILVLDADEFIDEGELQRAIAELKELPPEVDALRTLIYNFTGERGESLAQHESLRLYRNRPYIRFIRRIHEQLKKESGELVIGKSSLVIYHSGYLKKTVEDKNKHERNLPLLEKEMANSENAFDYFNLGNEYYGKQQYEKALEMFQKAYMKKPSIEYHWVPLCVVNIVETLKKLNQIGEALAVIEDAEKIWPQAGDFPYLRAHCLLQEKRDDDARLELLELVRDQDKYVKPIKSPDMTEYFPHLLLGDLYKKEGRAHEATYHYARAFAYNHKAYYVLMQLLSLIAEEADPEAFVQFLKKKQLPDDKENIRVILSVLLRKGKTEHIEKLLETLSLSETEREAIHFKQLIYKEQFQEAARFVHTVSDYRAWLLTGYVDLKDFTLLKWAQDEIDVPHDSSFIQMLTDKQTRLTEEEESVFFNMFDHILKHELKPFAKRLAPVAARIRESRRLNLAHRLYEAGEVEAAFELYRTVSDADYYDESTFLNLGDILRQQQYFADAYQFALMALGKGFNSFPVFRLAIEMAREIGQYEEMRMLITEAKKLYPDSRWLEQAEAVHAEQAG